MVLFYQVIEGKISEYAGVGDTKEKQNFFNGKVKQI
jgi:hypothetical protein